MLRDMTEPGKIETTPRVFCEAAARGGRELCGLPKGHAGNHEAGDYWWNESEAGYGLVSGVLSRVTENAERLGSETCEGVDMKITDAREGVREYFDRVRARDFEASAGVEQKLLRDFVRYVATQPSSAFAAKVAAALVPMVDDASPRW